MKSYLVNLPPVITTAGKLVIVPTLVYPFINAHTLIQLGHEPLALYLPKNMPGRPVLCPRVFKYVKYIYDVAGVVGFYRGLLPWVLTKQMYSLTFHTANKCFPVDLKQNGLYLTKDDKSGDVISKMLLQGVVCQSLAVIISQPFRVLTIRTIAQFIGNEDKYDGIFSGLRTILKEEGVQGLFSGLVPRLVGDILQFTLSTVIVHMVHKYVCKKDGLDYVIHLAVRRPFYSFTTISSCMAVSNCGLAAGLPPHMPHHPNMFASWSQSIGQLKKGSFCKLIGGGTALRFQH